MGIRRTSLIKFIMAGALLSLAALWIYRANQPFDLLGYFMLGVLILVAGFQVYFGIQAYRNEKAGLKSQDELSKRIREKAAAIAFRTSIFMWLFGLLFFMDMFPIHTLSGAKIVVALGMTGMVLIFLFTWVYLLKAGIQDEQQD